MVLLGATNWTDASSVCKGPAYALRIDAASNIARGNIFTKLCKACQLRSMASIPPSAFSAARIRQTQRDADMKLAKNSVGAEPTKTFYNSLMELSPLKYNSKLMNSIWGFYNRYSPHNVKKINDAAGDLHQPATNVASKSEPKINIPSAKFDNVWAAMSQSH